MSFEYTAADGEDACRPGAADHEERLTGAMAVTSRAESKGERRLGYDLHVTRRSFWADEEGPPISLEEWLACAKDDPELHPDLENPGSENWILVLSEGSWPLWWERRGELVTKNPDPPAIVKLVSLARSLGATVQGDDGEVYD
jgi:hypothetical protein